jgi:hypothetical protein
VRGPLRRWRGLLESLGSALLELLGFELLVLVLPRWGAAAVILAAHVVVCLGLAWAGRRALRRIESPGALVARRTHEHVEWWQSLLDASEGGSRDDAA